MIDVSALHKFITTKEATEIRIIPNNLDINIKNKTITFTGFKINDKEYLLTRERGGADTTISYECQDKNIITAIEYLYHMYNNLCE